MASTEYRNRKESTLFLFGPQALSFDRQFEKVRRSLADEAGRQHWIFDAVAELPRYWDALTEKFPKIKGVVPGEKDLADLDSWLRRAAVADDRQETLSNFPNLILTPLVVLTQLTQYWRYLELNHQIIGGGARSDLHANLLTRPKNEQANEVQTLGFCTGLLSAFAVASAKNQAEFEKYGAVAVRLAMLVGALVDAQEAWNRELGHSPSKSYATA